MLRCLAPTLLILLMAISPSIQIEKYVHMDLKGAAPRPAYFKQLLDIFSKLGAKGIVIEWEDMFPLSGILAAASHGNAYSKAEVVDILAHAHSVNLTVIPLVQTFGHTEWLLKTALFAPLRENQTFPMVMCIGSQAAVSILGDLISQVAALHSVIPMPYFHIGADEAFMVGECDDDRERMAELGTNDTKPLVFAHLQTMAAAVHEEYPDTKVLAWFDEFKDADPEMIEEFDLRSVITPVVWKYWASKLDQALPDKMWENLARSFDSAWGASSFKGANGANQILNAVTPYLANNQLWFDQLQRHSSLFNDSIPAIIITGWQRYDHFAVLCELMPTSMTSLAVCMSMIENGTVTEDDARRISPVLSCPSGTTLTSLLAGNDSCAYPGSAARTAIRLVEGLLSYYKTNSFIQNREIGWFGRTQRERAFASAWYVDALGTAYRSLLTKMDVVEDKLNSTLSALYFPEVAFEFINDNLGELRERINSSLKRIAAVDAKRAFPVRPIF